MGDRQICKTHTNLAKDITRTLSITSVVLKHAKLDQNGSQQPNFSLVNLFDTALGKLSQARGTGIGQGAAFLKNSFQTSEDVLSLSRINANDELSSVDLSNVNLQGLQRSNVKQAFIQSDGKVFLVVDDELQQARLIIRLKSDGRLDD